MKKFFILVFTFLLVVLSQSTFGQEENEGSNHGVFLELLGNGIFYSVNYDTRFSKKKDGFGGRVGFGYIGVDGDHYSSFPFLINYLKGKNGHYFEFGAGANYLVVDTENRINSSPSSIERWEGWSGTVSLGYRFQPSEGGFLFRAGLTPIFRKDEIRPFWPQVSIGYAF